MGRHSYWGAVLQPRELQLEVLIMVLVSYRVELPDRVLSVLVVLGSRGIVGSCFQY